MQVAKDDELQVQGKRIQNVNKDDSLHVKNKLEIVAGTEIVIKVGQSTITMKKNGDITIKGKNVDVKTDSNITMKGSKITQN